MARLTCSEARFPIAQPVRCQLDGCGSLHRWRGDDTTGASRIWREPRHLKKPPVIMTLGWRRRWPLAKMYASGSHKTAVTSTAIRKNIQRGDDEIRVTTGQATEAMITPMVVSLA